METKGITRRDFLKDSLVTALTLNELAKGNTQSELIQKDLSDLSNYDFILPRIKFACDAGVSDYWHAKPGGDANLLREMGRIIRCRTKPILNTDDISPHTAHEGQLNAVVTWDEPKRLANFPFLFMTGESHYHLNEAQERHLKEYVQNGGFLFMEDCVADRGSNDYFFTSTVYHLRRIFGPDSLKPVPLTHEIFHNIFDLSGIGLPRCWGNWTGAFGIYMEDRLAILLSNHDIHCGWCDSKHIILPGGTISGYRGDATYDQAIHMGINIIMYSLSH